MSSSNSPCAACKFLRRKCTQGCVFAPYFPPDNPQKFASVHRVFGASNVAKLLNELPAVQREDAVNSLAYEAQSRLHDPVYGCVGYISVLQSKLRQIQHDLEMAKKELSTYIGAAAYGPILPPPYQSQFAIPFHHQNQYHALRSSSSSSMNLLGMNSQMLISDRQQQQLVEEQQLAVAAVAAAAREQEMLRNLEQQQQYSGGGYVNPTGGNGGGAAAPLVMTQQQQQFENNAFQVQQQQLLQLHQFSDQMNNQTVGMGVGQPQVQRPKSEERGMESAVRHFEI